MSSTSKAPVQITTYTRPRGRLARGVVICVILMALSARKNLIAPGSTLYDNVLAGKPNAIKYATWAQNGTFYFLYGAHAIETAIFAYVKLHKHGMPLLSLAWVQWIVTCFAGGQFCFIHFDELVKSKTLTAR